ncbi:MAG: MBL fold metallo-hydrolase [Clostridium sp.]
MVKISVLNENTAGIRGYLAEHGLSLLIEHNEKRYLFDTGQSDVFMKNALLLEDNLLNLDAIILSHGHYDHCGGLNYLAISYREKEIPLPPIYVRENAFRKKMAINRHHITYRNIGIPWRRQLVDSALCPVAEKEEIEKGVWLLGNIPYTVDFEKKPDIFFIEDGEKKIPDYMEDEQLLIIETEEGLCVFAGCCHAGVINCLTHVKRSFPGRRIHSVFAGMHLTGESRERIDKTIEALEQMNLDILIPVHCTGIAAIGKMKDVFGEKCQLAETGKRIEIV